MRRLFAMLACSIVAAVGLVAAPAPSQALPPLPITITCTGYGCVGTGQLGPITVQTFRYGQGVLTVVCVGLHVPCDTTSAILIFNSQGLVGIVGSAPLIPTGAFFSITRYGIGAILITGGILVQGVVNQYNAAVVAITPLGCRLVQVVGGHIVFVHC